MVIIFDRVGLHKNMSKTNSMVFTPGFIWGQQGVEAYKQIDTGEVPAFRKRDKNRVSFEDYGGGGVTASSLRHHMKRSNVIVLHHIIVVDVRGVGTETYKVLFPRVFKSVECLV